MPNAKTHIFFGFFFSILVASLVFYINKKWLVLDYWLFLAIIPAIFIGSILPDCDIPQSLIIKILSIISVTSILCCIGFIYFDFYKEIAFIILYYAIGLLILTVTVPIVFNHRGFTHSLLFALIISSFLLFIHWVISIALFLGILSHDILDGNVSLF